VRNSEARELMTQPNVKKTKKKKKPFWINDIRQDQIGKNLAHCNQTEAGFAGHWLLQSSLSGNSLLT
jgi:hypothetical protein